MGEAQDHRLCPLAKMAFPEQLLVRNQILHTTTNERHFGPIQSNPNHLCTTYSNFTYKLSEEITFIFLYFFFESRITW
jgi:hypothetical protein